MINISEEKLIELERELQTDIVMIDRDEWRLEKNHSKEDTALRFHHAIKRFHEKVKSNSFSVNN